MDKFKSALRVQLASLQEEALASLQCQEDLARCYTQFVDWLSFCSPVDGEQQGQQKFLYVPLINNEVLIIQFTAGWHKSCRGSFRSWVYITLFNPDIAQKTTQLQLHWQAKQQVWHIVKWRRSGRWFSPLFYRRVFNQRLLERCLLDFIG